MSLLASLLQQCLVLLLCSSSSSFSLLKQKYWYKECNISQKLSLYEKSLMLSIYRVWSLLTALSSLNRKLHNKLATSLRNWSYHQNNCYKIRVGLMRRNLVCPIIYCQRLTLRSTFSLITKCARSNCHRSRNIMY